ncbi:MAG: ABC transporter ATP-binding protein [Candidatus Rokubacteria bacterium]|nr:ABC transporter ATP-binding protein [Candidatus Rokubacteria bacterium]
MIPLLRATGLSKTFLGPGGAPVPVLHDIDLEVRSGEFVAVTGSSGSGKTTLLNLLGLLEPASAGEVWLGDERVSHLGRRAQARVRGSSIGYVFQSFLLLSGLTALDNVVLAARYVGRDRAVARREALALLERMGVAHRKDHYPAQLSGGEQQRVAYCRAILNRPPLLLADEPTGNLDDEHARVILAELRASTAARGAAVVLVTHRPETQAGADRVLRLRDGRLAPGPAAPAA